MNSSIISKFFIISGLYLLFFVFNNDLHAQVSINADGTDPDGSAMLDVKSTSKGVLIPRMSATERDAITNPATGLMVFVSNDLSFYYYDGTAWVSLLDVFQHSDTTVKMNISPENVDFVFGSPQLNDDGNTAHDNRFFFNKTLGAFRAGETDDNEWDEVNTGELSTAFGKNNVASGKFSFALGRRSIASGMLSFAAGEDVVASGDFSFAMGDEAAATNFGSVAVGYLAEASGLGAVSLGWSTISPSALETTLGYYPTIYTPNSTFDIHPQDRLFTIGNGENLIDRSDALVILKNGNTGIGNSTPAEKLHVEGSIRMVDGNQQAGYVMTSDADGTASWQSVSGSDNQTLSLNGSTLSIEDGNSVDLSPINTDDQAISLNSNTLSLEDGGSVDLSAFANENTRIVQDADGDTKVQVEEAADEDVIRFDVYGSEAMRIEGSDAFAATSGLSVLTSNANGYPTDNTPGWQSFEMPADGILDYIELKLGGSNLSGVTSYNINIYEGKGTGGTLISSSTATPPVERSI